MVELQLNLENMTVQDIEQELKALGIRNGGTWEPTDCKARHRIGILIPFRDRDKHLKAFLLNMHPIFVRQKLAYKVYVIEPVVNITFNRGLLFNIGFVESNKDTDKDDTWHCHLYHDVDLLSEYDKTLYTCDKSPYHVARYQSKRNYRYNNNKNNNKITLY
jgi:beta-1,4-galactosyltransferase 1